LWECGVNGNFAFSISNWILTTEKNLPVKISHSIFRYKRIWRNPAGQMIPSVVLSKHVKFVCPLNLGQPCQSGSIYRVFFFSLPSMKHGQAGLSQALIGVW
jgi:hypothetical protein